MRQEGCDSPLSAWDSELDQKEIIGVCDQLRTCWENLLLTQGRKSPAVIEWEELRRKDPASLEQVHTDEEIRAALNPKYKEQLDTFFGEGKNYALRMRFQGAPARLDAYGFPLQKAIIILVIDKHYPFQYNDLVSEAKPAFAVGPIGTGEAVAGSIERTGVECGIATGQVETMTVENVRRLLEGFQNGTFRVAVQSETVSNERRKDTNKPAPVTGLRGIVLSFANRFAGKAA